jgi:UDPglucose--hexose-1-phosphate uridylyltransferase
MVQIAFEERDLKARVPDTAEPGTWKDTSLRWRRDPLTGRSARILTGEKLQPDVRPDLAALVAPPAFCPFDAGTIEAVTSTFPPELTSEGRIRRGKAVVVPNIMAYSTHSAVGVYDPSRHFLDLDQMTAVVIGDALRAMVAHAVAVRRFDPGAVWSSINANYLPPSGASLVHPHLQSAHDEAGLSVQRELVERAGEWPGASYWADLVDQEAGGPRWVGSTGRVAWLTPFAPSGFGEVWAVVEGVSDICELTDQDASDLGAGMSMVLGAYYRWNLTSFNFATMGGGPGGAAAGHRVLLKMVSRSNAEAMYRSDVTYFERLLGEALIDVSPEEVASGVRSQFQSAGKDATGGL